jgi:hypothetical protein
MRISTLTLYNSIAIGSTKDALAIDTLKTSIQPN